MASEIDDHSNDAVNMVTPAQRQRAEDVYRAMGNGCALSVSKQEARDVDLIAAALAHARREALEEAVPVMCGLIDGSHLTATAVNQAQSNIRIALDRLAREGVG